MLDWLSDKYQGITHSYKKTLKYVIEAIKFSILDFFIDPTRGFRVLGLDEVEFENLTFDVPFCNDLLSHSRCPLRLVKGHLDSFRLKFIIAIKRSDWLISNIELTMVPLEDFLSPSYAVLQNGIVMKRLLEDIIKAAKLGDARLTHAGIEDDASDTDTNLYSWLLRYSPNLVIQFENTTLNIGDQVIHISTMKVETVSGCSEVTTNESNYEFEVHLSGVELRYKDTRTVVNSCNILFSVAYQEDEDAYSWNYVIRNTNEQSLEIDFYMDNRNEPVVSPQDGMSRARSQDDFGERMIRKEQRTGAELWKILRNIVLNGLLRTVQQPNGLACINRRVRLKQAEKLIRLWLLGGIDFWYRLIPIIQSTVVKGYGLEVERKDVFESLLYTLGKNILLIRLLLTDRLTPTPDMDAERKNFITKNSALEIVLPLAPLKPLITLCMGLMMRYHNVEGAEIHSYMSHILENGADDEAIATQKIVENMRSTFLLTALFASVRFNVYDEATKVTDDVRSVLDRCYEWKIGRTGSSAGLCSPSVIIDLFHELQMGSMDICTFLFTIGRETIHLVWNYTNVQDKTDQDTISSNPLALHGILDLNLHRMDMIDEELSFFAHYWECGMSDDISSARKIAKKTRNYRKSLRGIKRADYGQFGQTIHKYVPNAPLELLVRQKLYLCQESRIIISTAIESRSRDWYSILGESAVSIHREIDEAFKYLDYWFSNAEVRWPAPHRLLADMYSNGIYANDILMASLWHGGNVVPICCPVKALFGLHPPNEDHNPEPIVSTNRPKSAAVSFPMSSPMVSNTVADNVIDFESVVSNVVPSTNTPWHRLSNLGFLWLQNNTDSLSSMFISRLHSMSFDRKVLLRLHEADKSTTHCDLLAPIKYQCSRKDEHLNIRVEGFILKSPKGWQVESDSGSTFIDINLHSNEKRFDYYIGAISCKYSNPFWRVLRTPAVITETLPIRTHSKESAADFYAVQYGVYLIENIVFAKEAITREKLIDLEMTRIELQKRYQLSSRNSPMDVSTTTKTGITRDLLVSFLQSFKSVKGTMPPWETVVMEDHEPTGSFTQFGGHSVRIDEVKQCVFKGSYETWSGSSDALLPMIADEYIELQDRLKRNISRHFKRPIWPPKQFNESREHPNHDIFCNVGHELIGLRITEKVAMHDHVCEVVKKHIFLN